MTDPLSPFQRYFCLLDEQPYYLVPPRLMAPESVDSLIVNPRCWFSWRGAVPPKLATSVRAAADFLQADCMVWVPDSQTGAVWPYWVGYDFIEYVDTLVPGFAVPANLPLPLRWVLAKAEILVPPDRPERKRWQWDYESRFLQQQFRGGFAALFHPIPPFHVGALRRYYRQNIRSGALTLGDDQVERRYVSHNEQVARFLNLQLVNTISTVVNRRVKASYAYVAAYQGGAVLERHTDREQCEYTVSICVDASPAPMGRCQWPINLDTMGGTLRVFQQIGEGLLFRGRKIAHHRDRLVAGSSVTSVLLHYVDSQFAGALD